MPFLLSEINEAIKNYPEDYIKQCDDQLDKRVETAAINIIENISKSPIVLLSGPTGSGKTTSAFKIAEKLKQLGVKGYVVSLDDYFMDVSPERTPRTENGDYDFESPFCLDLELLNGHFRAISEGREVEVPSFDFMNQMRRRHYSRPIRLEENEVVIFEGIHALGPEVAGRNPDATTVFVNVDSEVIDDEGEVCFMASRMRLVRRIIRDHKYRGASAELTLELWDNVRKNEKMHIFPVASNADLLIDSALGYEVSVMKNAAMPMLSAVLPTANRYSQVKEMINRFDLFMMLDPGLVPANSLLREFIGDSVYA